MSGERLAEALGRAIRENATGAVEWRDDKRRRLFFFRGGVLVLVQSNLKSESPERVAERAAGVPADALPALVAGTRLAEALGEVRGDVVAHPGVAAPGFEPLDVHTLLWAAADRLPQIPPGSFPRAVPAHATSIACIPAGAEVVRYLLDLDGSRPLDEVVDFGPDAPERLGRALAVACTIGAVDPGSDGVAAVGVTLARRGAPPAVAPAATAVSSADIAAFISGSLADAPVDASADQPPTAPPRGAPPAAAPRAAPAPSARPPRDTTPFAPHDATDDGSPTHTVYAPRTAAAAPPPPPPAPVVVDPVTAYFGPALDRIRSAPDHFAVLGTSWQDGPDVHRRAYLGLAQRLHPDRLRDADLAVRDVAAELFDRVRAAWEVLGDDARRASYIGRTVRGEKTEEELAMEKVRRILEAEGDFKRGLGELTGGRVASAHEHFQRAALAVPDELEFNAYAAYTTFRLAHGRDESAAVAAASRLAAVLKENERLDAVWVLHGTVLRMNHRDTEAREAFVSALRIRPSNPDAVREMRRLEREKDQPPPSGGGGGFLSKLLGKK